ncbi:AMP-activated serine/threonine-protein kinase regulatory subunit, partial [Mortierella sp. AM989]
MSNLGVNQGNQDETLARNSLNKNTHANEVNSDSAIHTDNQAVADTETGTFQVNNNHVPTISQRQSLLASEDYFGHKESLVSPTTSLSEALLPLASHSRQTSDSDAGGQHFTTSAQPSSTLTIALNNSNSNNEPSESGNTISTGTSDDLSNLNMRPENTITTGGSSDGPETENIDPIASYSAWRKKKDTETLQGTQVMMESFLKQHSAYDVLPVSYRQIVLDTTLLVKKALSVLIQYNIVSAPLWDSTKRKFAGMLTATDFINLIQFYYSHSSYTAAIREMDQFQISQLRDVEKVIGVPPPELFSLHPLQSLYDACQLLVESRAHRLPLVDVDSETGEEMIVSVLTQYRILKFIAMNYQDEKTLRQPLSELKIGIYTDVAVAELSTPVMSIIDMFVKRRISSVPIVDEEGVVLNVFETVDVMTLVKAGVYTDLDLCVAEALLRRPEDFAGVHTCTLNDSLSSIFGTIRKSQVHRLIVVDSGNKLKGIVSLSDIMRYLIGGTRDSPEKRSKGSTNSTNAPENGGVPAKDDDASSKNE